ncbi:MAG: peptide-binding protein [Candidatus Thiodiazotropha sp. (ex Dulcina madagascariensis)]|nr:peptide-binding protein [Candidatus Thiodiazotropha sp. (ex Dulcina madagascariensis)]MCU7926101.1 peptide-binding protein [Candidatus Thiodiazotropha sp. (ex Dulcina madagascariensis)]
MQRRLNGRDILYFGGLGLVLVTIILTMYMIDRQWQKMSGMEQLMREQAGDLREIGAQVRNLDKRIQQGVSLSQGSGSASSNRLPAAFQRAYAVTQQADYSPGDWMVQAFSVNLKSLTPFISQDVYSSQVQSYILETLLIRNPDTLEWQGLLASDWSVSEDGLTFVFKLREGLQFSDGAPLTAEDVVFTFEFIMTEAIQAPRERAYYAKIESVEALDPLTVKFQFAEPYFNALSLAGGMAIMPKHFYQPYLEGPNAFNQSKGLLLGSGPYRLEDPKGWAPDKGGVELRRNPRYWGPVQPAFDRLIWRVIENDSARLTTFRNGEIDTYSSRPREYQQLTSDEDLSKKAEHWEYMSPVAGYSYIGWNQRRNDKPTRFAKKEVRQAMTYLIDRQRIADEIYLGYAEVAVSPFNASSKQHDPALQARGYDQAKGIELLTKAGYADRDGDGVLEDSAGEPFEFELVYFQGNEDTGRMVLFLKDMLARAGILLQPKPTEWSVMLDLMKKLDFDAITLGWSSGLETDLYQMFHSSQIEGGGNNFINYSNPELDRLIEAARATVDEAKRMPLWQAAEAHLYHDQPYTFLRRSKSLVFIDRRLHNVVNTRVGLNVGQVPLENYVPAVEQRYSQ